MTDWEKLGKETIPTNGSAVFCKRCFAVMSIRLTRDWGMKRDEYNEWLKKWFVFHANVKHPGKDVKARIVHKADEEGFLDAYNPARREKEEIEFVVFGSKVKKEEKQ